MPQADYRSMHNRHVPEVPSGAFCVRVLLEAVEQGHLQGAERQAVLPRVLRQAVRLRFYRKVFVICNIATNNRLFRTVLFTIYNFIGRSVHAREHRARNRFSRYRKQYVLQPYTLHDTEQPSEILTEHSRSNGALIQVYVTYRYVFLS